MIPTSSISMGWIRCGLDIRSFVATELEFDEVADVDEEAFIAAFDAWACSLLSIWVLEKADSGFLGVSRGSIGFFVDDEEPLLLVVRKVGGTLWSSFDSCLTSFELEVE